MTREEAINILHGIRADNLNLDDAYTKDKYEALGKGIEAIENQKLLGEEMRKFREGIKDENVLVGFNMAIAICNKYLGE